MNINHVLIIIIFKTSYDFKIVYDDDYDFKI